MRIPPWATGVIGGVVLIAVWWVVALAVVAPSGYRPIPTPPEVLAGFADSGLEYYWRNFSVTLAEAAQGYLWGNGIALVLSALVLVLPRLEGVVMQIAIITYCLPIIAIGMLATIIIEPPSSGEPAGTAVFLAALSCFFTTVVGALLGLKAADRASLDVVAVYGGSRFTQLTKVRLVAALPAILNALQIAVPAAFLGAVLGEFMGQVDTGVGPAMIAAQQGLHADRLWGLALVSGGVALVGFGLLGLVARSVAPWARGRSAA